MSDKQVNKINFNKKFYNVKFNNKKELPNLVVKDITKEKYNKPKTEIEKLMCKIYSNVFKIPENEINRMSDFYKLGADCLNAIQILSKIRKELKLKMYIKDIMRHTMICDLSKYIESKIDNSKNDDNNKIDIITKHNIEEFPITAQKNEISINSIKNYNNKLDIIKDKNNKPVTEIEKLMCKIYSDVFKIPENEINRMSDFYKLGGDSLNAIQILSKIRKELKLKMYIKYIMRHTMICDLSKYIESKIDNSKNDDNNKIDIITKHNIEELPITSQQLGVYIKSIKDHNSKIYNTPTLLS